MEESIEVEDLKFEWGKKKGIGGKMKDAQFYESFTYDGEKYCLYDCVLACKDGEPEPFIGKIIKMWEHPRMENPKRVKLLWFFKPSEISSYLEGVSDILANELFLASGEGAGLTNVNSLESIGGKCSVLCILKDERNPQPSDEEIKNAHFVFRRTFDVGSRRVVDQIDDQIAGIDVKFIFNRTGEKRPSSAEKVEADITTIPDSMKPDGPSTSGLVRQNELRSSAAPSHRGNGVGGKKEKENEGHKQLARQKSALASSAEKVEADITTSPDSMKPDGPSTSGLVRQNELGSSAAPSHSGNVVGGKKEKENKGHKQLARQKSALASTAEKVEADITQSPDSMKPDCPSTSGLVRRNELGSSAAPSHRGNGVDGKKEKENEGHKQLSRQKSALASTAEKVEADITLSPDNMKPDGPSTIGLVRQNELGSSAAPSHRGVGGKKEKGIESHKQLARQKSTLVSPAEKVEADITTSPDSMEPDGPSTSGLVRQNELGSNAASRHRRGGAGGKKEKRNEGHKQLARQKSTLAEEESTKDSGGRDAKGHTERDSCEASGSRRHLWDGKQAKESKVEKQLTKQKSMVEEKESTKDSGGWDEGAHNERDSYGASGSLRSHWDGKKVQKQLSKQKSVVGEERYRKDSDGLDETERPHKRQKLDGSLTVSDGRNMKMPQKTSSNCGKDIKPVRIPGDKVTRGESLSQKPSFVDKKQDLQVLSTSEGQDTKNAAPVVSRRDKPAIGKSLSKKPSFNDKLSKCSEGMMLTDDDYKRNYQVIEVTRRPDDEKRKWFRDLAWEERMRGAEEQGTLVLLQNLDPTYTSDEVEDIVYSALNEQCTARMIERTSVTIPHIGEALLIFKRREVAERVVRKLDEGCLLLSNGRPLVATFAKLTPPGKTPQFFGHLKAKTPMQREMRDAVATSHCSQANTIEYDMAMEWCLHQSRCDHTWEELFKQQREEIKKWQVNFKPNTSVASEPSRPPSNLKITNRT